MITVLDIIQSTIFAGAILLLALYLNGSMSDASAEQTMNVGTRQTILEIGSILTNDLNKVGYLVPLGSPVITRADENGNITFKADVDPTTPWVDSLKYQVVAPTNSQYVTIKRQLNGAQATQIALPIDSVRFTYYGATGSPLSPTSTATQAGRDSIRSINVRFSFHPASIQRSGDCANSTSNTTNWERRIMLMNLKNLN